LSSNTIGFSIPEDREIIVEMFSIQRDLQEGQIMWVCPPIKGKYKQY
jgi:hypothetical protein